MKLLRSAAVAASVLTAGLAHAGEEIVTYPASGSFEDATFGVESAILDRGLVIDYVSHVGEMLNRTGEDLGMTTRIFENANVYLFCSATLSRKMMEADPMNIGHCPYGVFVAESGDGVVVGHRTYPEGPMQDVQAILSEIAQEAASF